MRALVLILFFMASAAQANNGMCEKLGKTKIHIGMSKQELVSEFGGPTLVDNWPMSQSKAYLYNSGPLFSSVNGCFITVQDGVVTEIGEGCNPECVSES